MPQPKEGSKGRRKWSCIVAPLKEGHAFSTRVTARNLHELISLSKERGATGDTPNMGAAALTGTVTRESQPESREDAIGLRLLF